jgi:hypothetical protein
MIESSFTAWYGSVSPVAFAWVVFGVLRERPLKPHLRRVRMMTLCRNS